MGDIDEFMAMMETSMGRLTDSLEKYAVNCEMWEVIGHSSYMLPVVMEIGSDNDVTTHYIHSQVDNIEIIYEI